MKFHTLPLPIQVINYYVGTKRNNNNNNNTSNGTSNGIPSYITILWHRITNLLTTAYRENNIGW